jgi:hypothetical protein
MPLWTGCGYEYQDSEWKLSKKFDREEECEKCGRTTMVNYCHTCNDCMHREWQRWRDTPRVSAEQESARIRKEGEDYERRKKALENPFGFGSVREIRQLYYKEESLMKCKCENWGPQVSLIDGALGFIQTTRGYLMGFSGLVPFISCPWCGKKLEEEDVLE